MTGSAAVGDLEAIRAVALRYCHGVDRLDVEVLASAYWPDAVDERARGDVGTYVAESIEVHRALRWSMHCVHNHLIELGAEGDTATGEVYVVAHLGITDPVGIVTFFGRYLDRYERRGAEWRIIERVCVHEDSLLSAAAPAPFDFSGLRPGAQDRRGGPAPRPVDG
jgi:hypothetical protein